MSTNLEALQAEALKLGGLLGTPTASGRRAFPLRVFPYTVVYRQLDAGIDLVIRHQHRKPSFGGARR